jgi:hypothetical protein
MVFTSDNKRLVLSATMTDRGVVIWMNFTLKPTNGLNLTWAHSMGFPDLGHVVWWCLKIPAVHRLTRQLNGANLCGVVQRLSTQSA